LIQGLIILALSKNKTGRHQELADEG
jgi:hypothetical protein